jgi:hypothetical protein
LKVNAFQLPIGRDRSRIGSLDYTLTAAGGVLAVWSGGMSIGSPEVGWFCAMLVLLGTLLSFAARTLLKKTPVIAVDGILYAGAVIFAIMMLPSLNDLLPGGGFPTALRVAAMLCWMIVLGSFFTWRDGTLLFQSIPAIALFGLVGCYDTFRNVTFAFFGFLLCLATQFARAHTRQMLQQAVDSGYFNRADAPGKATEVTRSMAAFERMKGGPWRWIAGPEWALASALVVVFVSLLGAPVIQESVKGVSGQVRLQAPPPPNRGPAVLGTQNTAQQPIGRGPLGSLSDAPVYRVDMDRLRYLRAATFDRYSIRGWNASWRESGFSFALDGPRIADASAAEINEQNQRQLFATIRPLTLTTVLPIPGEAQIIRPQNVVERLTDGTVRITSSDAVQEVAVASIEPDPAVSPDQAQRRLPPSLAYTIALDGIRPRVVDQAQAIVKGIDGDHAQATAIKRWISQQVKYNLNAPAIPQGEDPVEHFLFRQREGYCDLFASSMVLMARSVGIPARYVTGYLPDEERRQQSTFTVVQADAHAWAELFFEGVGWVVFDATEGSQEVPRGERGRATERDAWYHAAWVRRALDGLIVLGGLLVLVGAVFAARKTRSPEAVRRVELDRAFLSFVRVLQKHSGRRRNISQTPREFVRLVAPTLNGSRESAEELAREFDRAYFGRDDVGDDEVALLKSKVQDFGKAVKSEHRSSGYAVVQTAKAEETDTVTPSSSPPPSKIT